MCLKSLFLKEGNVGESTMSWGRVFQRVIESTKKECLWADVGTNGLKS